jgi:hypothetical protein
VPFVLEFEDRFETLDRWLPWYLPQWSSRERAAARYELDGGLVLRIEEEQQPWCPELDGGVRVSSLQTGVFAGPLGSGVGQHRFHPGAVVREEQEPRRLYTPLYGRVEVRLAACADPGAMVAFWLIGYEDEPERSGELCVCELFGDDLSAVGMGVHPFGDPALEDDFARVPLPFDPREPHEYAAEWTPGRVAFALDGEVVREVAQAPDYPLQLMLGLYAFADAGPPWPKRARVEWVRGYRWAGT